MARIVIVEDDDELRQLVVHELEDAGHELVEASDGADGLHKIKNVHPDLIIADITMPNMDGYRLRKMIQQSPHFARTPFLFMSALAIQQAQDQGLDVAETDLITKPVDFDDLHARISERFSCA